MSVAIDTIGSKVANPGATFTATSANTGDSFLVRAFAPTDRAWIQEIIRRGAAAGGVRVRSPLLHDNVVGIEYFVNDSPARVMMPYQVGSPVYPTDTLIVECTGATAADTVVVAHSIYYSNLPGASTRLHSWGDVSGIIKNVKTVKVPVTNSATIGNWTDTAINTSENLLHAGVDYAVLGYITDTLQAFVGVKGQETNNLRVGGWGSIDPSDTANYFVWMSMQHGMPWVPVFNANNAAAFFVSTMDNAASSTPNITVILAELANNITP